MQIQDRLGYQTAGGITVSRRTIPAEYTHAADELCRDLNQYQGLLLSSSYEYPGRYTRWDVGFSRPSLQISSCGLHMHINALNDRGEVLLPSVYRQLLQCRTVADVTKCDHGIEVTIADQRGAMQEELRTRRHTVFSVLRDLLKLFHSDEDEYLGLFGAFGYDLTFQFDPIRLRRQRDANVPDMKLFLPDRILVQDHYSRTAVYYDYEFDCSKLNGTSTTGTTAGLERNNRPQPFVPSISSIEPGSGDHQPGEYAATVSKAIESFRSGDLFEVVPGQMFFERCNDTPAAIFKRLRSANPAPYGALINLGGNEFLVSASPEMYVRVRSRRVETCPISGTIARGQNALEDAGQILSLLNSEKEASELTMCTDVDRNDKSRICEPGSINVIGRRQIELYSRLIHTVDHVEGRLKEGFDALDAFLAHTWAVTVTGAPKHAAIQFIEDNEKSPRGWYGGAIGQLGFNGNLNTGLTLRTIHIQNGIAEVRAGATLLIDSDPDKEEAETRLKASALLAAIRDNKPSVQGSATGTLPLSRKFKLLMVDHQDSFVHTLSSYFQNQGAEVQTVRHDLVAEYLDQLQPDLVVLSPGPGRPRDFQLQQTIDRVLKRGIPLFGVCLGLQGIVEYFGGRLGQLDYPMHGKPSRIEQCMGSMFAGIAPGFQVGRYHSLVAADVSEELQVTATSDDGVVMAVEHRSLPVAAVQFHPESILSLEGNVGEKIISNVVNNYIQTPEPVSNLSPQCA